MSDPAANKEIVKKLTQEFYGDFNPANIEKYFNEDYIEHNPDIADGRDSLKKFVESLAGEPKSKPEIQRIIAEGDYVWAHWKGALLGKVYAIADVYRFENGKIQEHWDVLQDTHLDGPAANPHPFF